MKRIFIVVLILLSPIIIIYTIYRVVDNYERYKNAIGLIGEYELNIRSTNLGEYAKDTQKYKHLRLTLYKDRSFKFNSNAPFINDTFGKWTASGSDIEEWNNLYYRGGNVYTQFELDSDSTLLLNNVQPRDGFRQIPQLRFKRISSTQ
jgi:hypothetical protein